MRSSLLFGFLIFCFTHLSAQDTAHIVDRVSTNDNKATIGQITMDKKGDFLLINVYRQGIDTINYTRIITVEYGIDNPLYDSTAHIDTPMHSASAIDTTAKPAIAPMPQASDSNLSIPNINNVPVYNPPATYHPERLHTGIGFTFAGIALMGAGAALIALTPKDHGQSFAKSITPGTSAGFIAAAAGIGMTIPGAIIWRRYPHGYKRKK